MIELVEMEIVELLNEMGFNGDETPIVKGSALMALDGKREEIGMIFDLNAFKNRQDLTIVKCRLVW